MPNAAQFTDDHWVDPGGRTLEALERFLAERVGESVTVSEVTLVTSVEEMRDLVFRSGVVAQKTTAA